MIPVLVFPNMLYLKEDYAHLDVFILPPVFGWVTLVQSLMICAVSCCCRFVDVLPWYCLVFFFFNGLIFFNYPICIDASFSNISHIQYKTARMKNVLQITTLNMLKIYTFQLINFIYFFNSFSSCGLRGKTLNTLLSAKKKNA